MGETAIRVENLSKQYHIGGSQKTYDRLGEKFVHSLTSPVRKAGKILRGEASGAADWETVIWALEDVSFDVDRGESVGIIGRNGAGKSTLLKILSRIVEPTGGRAEIFGRVSSLLEVGTGFHPELTGRENIFLNGAILGMKKSEIERNYDGIVEFSGVEAFIDTPVKHYSSGMAVRLAFSVAAYLEPEVLLVDEVLAVGDFEFQKKCLGKMQAVAEEGRTVIFVSHQMAAITRLCSRAILIDGGHVKMIGPSEEVVQAYLGNTGAGEDDEDIFPVINSQYRIGINSCRPELIENRSTGAIDLQVHIEVSSESVLPLRRIGVGFGLTTLSGDRVTTLGPRVTNFVFDIQHGINCFVLECPSVDRHLATGEYAMQLFLAMPGVDKLIYIDRAAVIRIPKTDLFGTGQFVTLDQNGPVVLPLSVRRE